MLNKFKLAKEEDGIAVVWFAIIFVVIVFITGLAIDGGRLYETKAELRKAADAAVLSGAQELLTSDASVTNIVNQILVAHNEQSNLKQLLIRPNNEEKVTVTLERNVPLFFMRMIGFNNAPVNVRSTAAIYPMKETVGTVPLGIDENIELKLNKEYTFKVDSGDSTAGNFGILALSGVGARLYEEALKYGYDVNISADPDRIIDTQTGNVAQKTVEGVNYRIDTSPYSEYDPANKDDPRVICILIYKPHKITSKQVKSVEITGFAYFYLSQPSSKNDSTVKGFFINKVGKGIGDEEALNKGAYAVKLVE